MSRAGLCAGALRARAALPPSLASARHSGRQQFRQPAVAHARLPAPLPVQARAVWAFGRCPDRGNTGPAHGRYIRGFPMVADWRTTSARCARPVAVMPGTRTRVGRRQGSQAPIRCARHRRKRRRPSAARAVARTARGRPRRAVGAGEPCPEGGAAQERTMSARRLPNGPWLYITFSLQTTSRREGDPFRARFTVILVSSRSPEMPGVSRRCSNDRDGETEQLCIERDARPRPGGTTRAFGGIDRVRPEATTP